MVLRKVTTAEPHLGEQPTRQGRHSRPKPFGGRFRLPTLRFSGAAMAMSTVVGLSIATTWLLNEQQAVGRRAGFAAVGATPPPSPRPDDQHPSRNNAAPDATATPSVRASGASSGTPGSRSGERTTPPAAPPAASPSPSAAPATTPPPATESPAATAAPSTAAATAAPTMAAPTPETPARPEIAALCPEAGAATPSAAPTAPGVPLPLAQPPLTQSAATGTGTGTTGVQSAPHQSTLDKALTGAATVERLGLDGTRYILGLTVTEPLTALQAEFRLSPAEIAPGTTAWTNLAGAEMTMSQEQGALVYRFAAPAGADVRPGNYTFGVRGFLPAAAKPTAAEPSTAKPATAQPTTAQPTTAEASAAATPAPVKASATARPTAWTASAFVILNPRAVAAIGAFESPAPAATATPVPVPSGGSPAR